MAVVFVGVRHHSPACARLVASTIAEHRPAFVLVEGPADMNDRLDELTLDHRLPIAVFTSYRDATRSHASWAPLCAYSPEWVALTEGRRGGAEVRLIDLPAWHPAFVDRVNRYADAERRYSQAVDRLCAELAVDNVDTLWDHLFEIPDDDRLVERLAAYFDLVRGDTPADEADGAREAYMAAWVRAAAARAGDRTVLVVTGGFHRPALIRLASTGGADDPDAAGTGPATRVDWPDVPAPPAGATAASYLVPYSFHRLDAFHGYQAGMPSPGYYQAVWDGGPRRAGVDLMSAVVDRLRERRQPVSTSDLVAARTMAHGLARLRGHRSPARTDVLDALVSALVTDALDVPLPWTGRGDVPAGTHPVVSEMLAALRGRRVGRLHPATPRPPLIHDVDTELERHQISRDGAVTLDLAGAADLARSRVLHRLRVLAVPGFLRTDGPHVGSDPVLVEHWRLSQPEDQVAALTEAGSYGATLLDAATAALTERVDTAEGAVHRLATVLFDAALCGIAELSDLVLARIGRAVALVHDLPALGTLLDVALGLWRHDRLFGMAGSGTLGRVLTATVDRVLWLVEGVRGADAPADPDRLHAVRALRDTIRYGAPQLSLDPDAALAVMARLAIHGEVPPDLRGAAYGFGWSLAPGAPDRVDGTDPVRVLRGIAGPRVLGDWLAGVFVLAREEVRVAVSADGETLVGVLDDVVGAMDEADFLAGLPGLRQAFEFFPPAERAGIARELLRRRGLLAAPRTLLTPPVPVDVLTAAGAVERHVDEVLSRAGLA